MELPKPAIFTKLLRFLNMNRVIRLNMHYNALKANTKAKSDVDKLEYTYFSNRFERYHKVASRLVTIRGFFYFLLYASLVINVIKLIPVLAFIVPFIRLTGSLVSTTFLVVVIFVISVRINLYIELLNECLTHLIAIYHKNPKRKSAEMLDAVSRTI